MHIVDLPGKQCLNLPDPQRDPEGQASIATRPLEQIPLEHISLEQNKEDLMLMKQIAVALIVALNMVACVVFIASTLPPPSVRIPVARSNDIGQVGQSVTITGCSAEDTCSIDYKADGTWVVYHRAPGTY